MRSAYLPGNRQATAGHRTIEPSTQPAHARRIPVQDVIERYIACWNQTDPALRRKLIDEVWAQGASYTDPLAEAVGHDAIDATIAADDGRLTRVLGFLDKVF